jgi:hypothetical protein
VGSNTHLQVGSILQGWRQLGGRRSKVLRPPKIKRRKHLKLEIEK